MQSMNVTTIKSDTKIHTEMITSSHSAAGLHEQLEYRKASVHTE